MVGDSDLDVAVARLNPNGTLDRTFSGDGRKIFSWGTISRATAVLVRPDRRIIVAGNMTSDTMAITRIRADSTPETTTFVDVGELADSAADAALAPGGKVVAAGSRQDGGDLAVVRLDAAGGPDATFGSAGRVSVDFGVAAFGFAVAVQADGRIVVAGRRTGNDDFAVARLLG